MSILAWRNENECIPQIIRGTMPISADLEQLRSTLPVGYRLEMGGSIEESAKANAALFDNIEKRYGAATAQHSSAPA